MFRQSKLKLFLFFFSVLSGFLFGIVYYKYQVTVNEFYQNSHPFSALTEQYKKRHIEFDPRLLNSRDKYREWLEERHFKRVSINPEIKSFSPDRTRLRTEAKLLYKTIKVHCLVLTRSREHSHTVLDTWARNCNSISFYSKFNDSANPFLTRLFVGDESIYSARTFCKLFIDLLDKEHKFDWLLITIDGTFAIVDNLRFHVVSFNSSLPYYMGRPVKHLMQNAYNAYDSGIVLSRGAIQKLIESTFKSEQTCLERFNATQLIPNASFDSFIGYELYLNSILPMFTMDKQSSLFHPFTPARHIQPKLIYTQDTFWSSQVLPTYSGLKACSDKAITFGSFIPGEIRLVDYILYHVSIFNQQYSGKGNDLPPIESYKVPSDLDKRNKV